MADNTQSAIRVNLDNWYSVNSLFNIPIGEEFLLHNLSTKPMQVSISDTQPTKGALNWLPLYTYKPYLPQAFESEVWVYGDGFINTSALTYDDLDKVTASQSGDWNVSVDNLPDVVGTWGYASGSNGTLNLTGGKRVIQITAISLEVAGGVTINGGNIIRLPYGNVDKVSTELTIHPQGNLVDPVMVFTDTDSYFVEYVN
jgi:hypothetical protein